MGALCLAGRHTGVCRELLPADLHVDHGVGTQVQIPARLPIRPALGPGDDVRFSCHSIKQRRRQLLARAPPDGGEQEAGNDARDAGDRRLKQMPFGSSAFAIQPQVDIIGFNQS